MVGRRLPDAVVSQSRLSRYDLDFLHRRQIGPIHFFSTGKPQTSFENGSVSGSGTGPGDPGSRGPALPDPETFPYEWLGVRQYISMSCVSCL